MTDLFEKLKAHIVHCTMPACECGLKLSDIEAIERYVEELRKVYPS